MSTQQPATKTRPETKPSPTATTTLRVRSSLKAGGNAATQDPLRLLATVAHRR